MHTSVPTGRSIRTWTQAFCPALHTVLVALALVMSGGVAKAGDYAHFCRSADGAFVMNDEELRAFDVAKGEEAGNALTYRVLSKLALRRDEGYCVSSKAPAKRHYKYQGSTYALHIAFHHRGQPQKVHMICEMASSGLPAAYNCDREVKTLTWQASPQAPPKQH